MPDDTHAGAFARELSRHPNLCTRLLDEHRPDDRGRCRGCRSAGSLPPRHPCPIASVVRAALGLIEERTSRTGPAAGDAARPPARPPAWWTAGGAGGGGRESVELR